MLKPALTLAAWFCGILSLVLIGATIATDDAWPAHRAVIAMGCYLLASRGIELAKWLEREEDL